MAIASSVRAARADDLDRIAAIKVKNWADTYAPLLSSEILRPFLDEAAQRQYIKEKAALPGTLLLVAEDKGEVAGFALTFLDADPEPWLESLHVLAQSRGRGAGTELMSATAAELLDRGHRAMALGVVVGNDRAARYYERLGAELVKVEPVTWAQGVNHAVYRCRDVALLIR